MKRIKGNYSEAVVFTDEIEDEAVEQIKTLCDQEFAKGANLRIMPDVHAGAGCTIGTTMKIKDKIVPNLVGVDIGCGMETLILRGIDLDPISLDRFVRKKIPSGFKIHGEPHRVYGDLAEPILKELHCPVNMNKAMNSIGSLGGGNHFIEANRDDDGNTYIVIHSGSRHLGLEIANYYQDLAWRKLSQLHQYDAQKMIEKLKAEGREKEIANELEKLKKMGAPVPKDLAYLEGQDFDDYLHDMAIAQQFAVYNRHAMMFDIINAMDLSSYVEDSFTTIHNYIDIDSMILRKGSVSAKKGEKLLIPINMRDGSLICEGKGNDEWNQSAPHGAGRLMSRTKAFKTLSLDKFKEQMSGIYSTSVGKNTLDESPMAYKSAENILNNISPTAKVIKTIRPIYNFKACDSGDKKRKNNGN